MLLLTVVDYLFPGVDMSLDLIEYQLSTYRPNWMILLRFCISMTSIHDDMYHNFQ